MPSAPKKNKRREADFYETPEWCTEALLNSYNLNDYSPGDIIIEPCAGYGAISRIIKKFYPDSNLYQYELNKNDFLDNYGYTIFGDYFQTSPFIENAKYVITNPPFSLAQEFIERCRIKYPNAEIIMLLPLSFFGSAKRQSFWEQTPPNKLSILSDRPSFTKDGKTDSSTYSWIHWFPEERKHIFVRPSFLTRKK